MGVVRREELQSRLLKGLDDPQSLVITPLLDEAGAFDSDSVDVRLGQTFLLPKSLQQPYFCPDRKSHDTIYVELFVPFGRYLIVPAHQTVLGATLEFIKLPRDLCAEILTKSSIARTFVVIETAPWVHPEYRGCLTLEIANVSNTPVLLYPGRKIGQLIFMHLDPDMTRPDTDANSPRKGKLDPTYFGPVYPEGPKFKDPDEDLAQIGITATWTIEEVDPDSKKGRTETSVPTLQRGRHQKLLEVWNRIHGTHGRALTEVPDYLLSAVMESVYVIDPVYDSPAPGGLVQATVEGPNQIFGAGALAGGVCKKPGNIRLNIGTFARLGPSAYQSIHTHSVIGILQVAWALWEIFSNQTVNLTTQQVVVFRAMWELSRGERALAKEEILGRCQADFDSQNLGVLAAAELETILSDLERIKCIKPDSTLQTWTVAEEITYQFE
jgi:dCTP deaminase